MRPIVDRWCRNRNGSIWTRFGNARDQVEILKDPIATKLHHSNYHQVVEGFGAHGLLLDNPDLIKEKLLEAMTLASESKAPVLINAILDKSDFRKGSISM